MVIKCVSRAAAGAIIALLLNEALVPATHFRANEVDRGCEAVRITVVTRLTDEQETRLRSTTDAMTDCAGVH